MIRVVAIQFNPAGKVYDFQSGNLELAPGEQVVVETERGLALGLVVTPPRELSEGQASPQSAVQRKLTIDDEKTLAHLARREKEAHEFCLRRIKERGLDMKLVRVEQLFDGSKAIFYFTADGRIDFRELVKDLAHTFHTRIEMRQIGVRDESKMVGGIGICGRELCCATFLRDFQPVSVKMAKEQNLALNPSKISGQCGRLLCCLDYEYETYCELRKSFPKCGKRARTVQHSGVVEKMNILTGELTLKLDDGKQISVHIRELVDENNPPPPPLEPARLPEPQQRKEREPQQQRRPRPAPQQAAKLPVVKQQELPVVAQPPAQQPAETDMAPKTEDKPKKKRRNRRHGHKKPSGDRTPESSPQE